jgi:SnoaL-like polyketide cyclase
VPTARSGYGSAVALVGRTTRDPGPAIVQEKVELRAPDEGDYIACQTTIAGIFMREFTRSPVGPLSPNGRRVVFELIDIFRCDDQGRVAEEWVQTDNRSRLRQLGAEGR